MIGKDMLSQWDHAVNRLEELGEYTVEQANEEKNWLREQIKLVG
jgi:hypothetical protein